MTEDTGSEIRTERNPDGKNRIGDGAMPISIEKFKELPPVRRAKYDWDAFYAEAKGKVLSKQEVMDLLAKYGITASTTRRNRKFKEWKVEARYDPKTKTWYYYFP